MVIVTKIMIIMIIVTAVIISFSSTANAGHDTETDANDVILAGVVSFSSLSIPSNAEDYDVCKFGAFFLSPGDYTIVLADKDPEGTLYSDSLRVRVEP